MTKRVSVTLGGTNILAIPVFLRVPYVLLARLLGIVQFDTAQYYGESEQVLSRANLRNTSLITKWGLGEHTDTLNPDPNRWGHDFSADQLQGQITKSRSYIAENVDFGFALHKPSDKFVGQHIEVLLQSKARGLVARIGYSCDTPAEVLQDNSWCDFIITHYSLVENFTEFGGQVFLHGVFKDGLNTDELRTLIAQLPRCQEVSFLAGTSKPWRLLNSILLIKKVVRFGE